MVSIKEDSSFNYSASSFSYNQSMTEGASIGEILGDPLNIVLLTISLLALAANLLTIVATLHIPRGQTAHSKLILSLSVADICIIVSVFLHLTERIAEKHHEMSCILVANKGFLDFALLATLVNLLAMGIDHYIAIKKPLHYHFIMSSTRTNVMIIIIWAISLLGGLLEIIIGAILDIGDDLTKNNVIPANSSRNSTNDSGDPATNIGDMAYSILNPTNSKGNSTNSNRNSTNSNGNSTHSQTSPYDSGWNSSIDMDFCDRLLYDMYEGQIYILGLVIVVMFALMYFYFHIFLKVRSRACHRFQEESIRSTQSTMRRKLR